MKKMTMQFNSRSYFRNYEYEVTCELFQVKKGLKYCRDGCFYYGCKWGRYCVESCEPRFDTDHEGCCECSSICFPATAKVTLQNGKSATMSDLQIGDYVQTGR